VHQASSSVPPPTVPRSRIKWRSTAPRWADREIDAMRAVGALCAEDLASSHLFAVLMDRD
jgi:hypothetical protein